MFFDSHFFQRYKNPEMYIKSGVKYCEPMTATEVIGGEDTELLNDNSYYVEEKFDGTRATLHLFSTPKVMLDYFNSIKDDKLALVVDFVVNVAFDSVSRLGILKWYDENCTDKYLPNAFQNVVEKEVKLYFTLNKRESFFYTYFNYEVYLKCNEFGIQCTFKNDTTNQITYLWQVIAPCVKELIDLGGFYPTFTYARCFSRRVSKKTNWFCENTDSVPQMRDLDFPVDLSGTVIDGEIFIPDKPFKDASSTLNCTWDEAVRRQSQKGMLVLHAFDILYYKGVKVENMPLHRRKYYLEKVCKELSSEYVKCVPYYFASKVPMGACSKSLLLQLNAEKDTFPELYNFYKDNPSGGYATAKEFYQSIVLRGGEGVILKTTSGKYFHKRGREYQKVKKFLTRDVIIMGFEKPTKEYNGKFPNDHWSYWENSDGNKVSLKVGQENSASELLRLGFKPVTKFYYEDWIGEIRFGVSLTPEEEKSLPKNKKFNIEEMIIDNELVRVLEVGQCSGFDEETRYLFTCNARDFDGKPICIDEYQIEANDLSPISWVGTVIEVKAQEVFKDTGKLRHPRFMRIREDKSGLQCNYTDHIR